MSKLVLDTWFEVGAELGIPQNVIEAAKKAAGVE